ncbi:LysM domain-containing protein [Lachnospiraceae bacterium]|nr:LysM domain-containing protein [Lachnospiraceae bacterium]
MASAFVLIALMSLVGKPLQALADEGSVTEYHVQKNDSLYKIAKTQLGSGDRWSEIFESNKDVIKDPSLIYNGQILKIPGGSLNLVNENAAATDNSDVAEQPELNEQAEANIYAQQLYNAVAAEEPLVTAQLNKLEVVIVLNNSSMLFACNFLKLKSILLFYLRILFMVHFR